MARGSANSADYDHHRNTDYFRKYDARMNATTDMTLARRSVCRQFKQKRAEA